MFGLYQSTGGLKGQVCSLAYELAATWRWPTFARMNQSELSHMARSVDYSTTNIVIVIIIIIISRPIAIAIALNIGLGYHRTVLQCYVINFQSS